MKIKLIANPIAGGNARSRIDRLCGRLAERGCAVELFLTAARGDAQQAAREARDGDYARIVVAGGDGTLNEVLNGLTPSSIPVAFIPLGTVNVLALELGIPFDPLRACDLVLDGEPTPVSLGDAGGHRFLLMAGIGFDAGVVRAVDGRLKRRIGRCAYLAAALKTLWHWRPPQLRVTLADGSVHAAGTVIVGNGRLYGGRFALTPHARLQDASFEVLLLPRSARCDLLRVALGALFGRPPAAGVGSLLRTSRLAISGSAPVQVDGDDLGDLPCDFTVLPDAVTLIFPRSRP